MIYNYIVDIPLYYYIFIMKKIAFIKVESNGLPKTKDKVTIENLEKFPNLISIYYKICSINEDEKKINIDYLSYNIIKPTFEINKYAQKIHKLSIEELNKGKDLKEVLTNFNDDLVKYKVKIFIGHNILFDFNIIKGEILRNKIDINLDDNFQLLDVINYKHSFDYPKLEILFEKLYGRKFKKSHERKSLINIIIKCFEFLYFNYNSTD